MGFLIGFITFILVLDCLLLILLVIVQLPKKEAGVGIAFGGGAADALFGAGSGNVLTKITKYAAGILFGLAIILSVMQSHYQNRGRSSLEEQLSGPGRTTAPVPAESPTPEDSAVVNTNSFVLPLSMTNAPGAPAGK